VTQRSQTKKMIKAEPEISRWGQIRTKMPCQLTRRSIANGHRSTGKAMLYGGRPKPKQRAKFFLRSIVRSIDMHKQRASYSHRSIDMHNSHCACVYAHPFDWSTDRIVGSGK